jgi:hypothetical protein
MSEAGSRLTNVKDLVIPVTLLLSLIGTAWAGGIKLGTIQAEIKGLAETIARIDPVARARADAEVGAELRRLGGELDRQERELRLLRDYVEGRIGQLPYDRRKP